VAQGAITINPTGNAMLASAGTGDVLAGWVGGLWSRHAGLPATGADDRASMLALEAAIAAVWLHGHAADLAAGVGSDALPLRAADLIEAMRRALPLSAA
jgi:NAD(P)H-hydrate repair Nnr-like enzyme with NAD(P)H-hydrate dehydratase domain